MYLFEPTYHTITGTNTLVTITGSGTVGGYPQPSRTVVLGAYPDAAIAEAAWEAWSDAQESEARNPWEGITLPEFDGHVSELIAAALEGDDVVTVRGGMANAVGNWTTTGDAKEAEEAKYRAAPLSFGIDPEALEDEDYSFWDSEDYPAHEIITMIRQAGGL